MARITPEQAGGQNRCAFLDAIANSEIGPELLSITDDGYNVLVGSTPENLLTFKGYGAPPGIYNKSMNSTASGRYQILNRYAVIYIKQLSLPDFGPVSQDRIALQQIRERNALSLIDAGAFSEAVTVCSNIWASLPGNNYGQHVNSMSQLQAYYIAAGGSLAASQTQI